MKNSDKNSGRIFKNTVINNDLKKLQHHPLILKKAERAMELLSKVKDLQNIL